MALDRDAFKQVMGRWTTGVTIVTARAGDAIHGMTVSAFTEVSLEPPLVLVCADKSSNTHPLIAEGGVFAVNILARNQAALSDKFASKQDEHLRFEGVDWSMAETGSPILPDTVAALDCRVHAAHESGDHVIYLGEVLWTRCDPDKSVLLYSSGTYGDFKA